MNAKVNSGPMRNVTTSISIALLTLALGCDRSASKAEGKGHATAKQAAHATPISATGQHLKSAASPTGPSPSPQLLLTWNSTDKPNSARTTLWRDDGSGYQRVADGPGIALFANKKLWKLTFADAPHAEVDCACAPEAGFEDKVPVRCVVQKTTKHPALIAEDGTRLWPAGKPPEKPDTKELHGNDEPSFTAHASFGSLVIGALCHFRMACGAAHPSHDCEQIAFDIETGKRVSLFSAAEQTKLLKKLLPRAHARLRKSDDFFDGNDAVEFARLDFALGGSGALAAQAVFAGQTSYANSSDWGAYRMLTDLPMNELPERLQPFQRAPDPAAKAATSRNGSFGWSTLTATPEQAAAILKAFSAPRAPTDKAP